MKAEQQTSIEKARFLMVCTGETYSGKVVNGKELLAEIKAAVFGSPAEADASPDIVAAYQRELDNEDQWNHDQDHGPVHWQTDVGETDHINFYRVTE